MRDWFIFRYGGRYFQCIALPFGWGPSALGHALDVTVRTGASQLRLPSTRFFGRVPRCSVGIRNCVHAGSLLYFPSASRAFNFQTWAYQAELKGRVERCYPSRALWCHRGLSGHEVLRRPSQTSEGEVLGRRTPQGGTQRPPIGIQEALRTFCGVCMSLYFPMPWATFYSLSLYWNLSLTIKDLCGRCRLSHQSTRDVIFLATSLAPGAGRPCHSPVPTGCLDAHRLSGRWIGGYLTYHGHAPRCP